MSRQVLAYHRPERLPPHARLTRAYAWVVGALLLVLVALPIGVSILVGNEGHSLRPRVIVAAAVTIGIALLLLGEMLRRTAAVWTVQALLAVAATIVTVCAAAALAAACRVPGVTHLGLEMAIGAFGALPLTIHAWRALRELRKLSDAQSPGFQPALTGPAEAQRNADQSLSAHRSDSSR